MTDTVHRLSVVKQKTDEEQINESTVQILRELLRDAKAGKVTEVVVIAQDQEGWRPIASMTGDTMRWVGRLETLKLEWISHYNRYTDTPVPPRELSDEDE